MTPSPSPVSMEEKSESNTKPLVLAAAVFVAVMGSSFVFLRYSGSDAAARGTHRTAEEGPAKDLASLKEGPSGTRDDGKVPPDVQRERLLENVGSVSSIYLYQNYLNIGLLADAVKNETYTKDEAGDMLNTTMSLLVTVDVQMKKLGTVGLEDEEVDAVQQVRKISNLLHTQAGHLQSYWKTGGKASLDQYREVRRQSWAELRAILGLGEQKS